MSNEKPVRITVGDVKEVAEATAIQEDTLNSRPVSSVSYTASTPDTSGNGMVYLGGLIGLILVILAGYFGVLKNEPKTNPTAAATISSAPSSTTESPVSMPGAPKVAPGEPEKATGNEANSPAPAANAPQ